LPGHDNVAMGQVLGIDVGTKTLGLAVSDPGRSVAMPLTTIRRKGLRKDLAALREILEDREIREVVIGLPLNLDGSPGAMSAEADRIAAEVETCCGVTVRRFDERLTTAEVERMLIGADVSRRRRKDVVDKLAATVILQGWLDAWPRQPSGPEGEPVS
jgi:putative holliday junction resolvase